MDAEVPKVEGQDPFDGKRWSVALAAAWIIWRSREYVGQLLSDLTQSEGAFRSSTYSMKPREGKMFAEALPRGACSHFLKRRGNSGSS
jgi:hypothetical protein